MHIAISNRFKEIEKLIAAAEDRNIDAQVAAYFCKLGCVMICGAVERSVEILVSERICKKSAPQVRQFLKSFFKKGRNLDCENITNLLFSFDKTWGERFNTFVSSNDRIKSGLASCYAARNSIAHGGSQSLGPAILRQYFDDARATIDELESSLS